MLSFFDAVMAGDFDTANPFKKSKFKVEIKEYDRPERKYHGRFIHYWDEPSVDEIPDIINPSMHGMVGSDARLRERMQILRRYS